MLRSMNDLEDYTIRATDGAIGVVKDFYDDQSWVIRYLAIDTGNWLYSRSVLITGALARHQPWLPPTVATRDMRRVHACN